jgi:hypothetical protein
VTRVDPLPDGFPLYSYRLRSFRDIIDTIMDKAYLAGKALQYFLSFAF